MKTFEERKQSVENYMMQIKRKRRNVLTGVTSLVLVLAVMLGVFYFPGRNQPNDKDPLSAYVGTEYYHVIRHLQAQVDAYKDYNEMLQAGQSNQLVGAPMPNYGAPSYAPEGDSTNGSYEEVTDNQVEGVIEADILKRSDRYAFYLRDEVLSVYSIEGADSALIGSYTVAQSQEAEDVFGPYRYDYTSEMYLSLDCKTVTLVTQAYFETEGRMTILVNLDVTDPANITETGRVYFKGAYLSSRLVDGQILLTYRYGVNISRIDFDNPETFVPQYGQPGDMHCIPGSNIVSPETVGQTGYTVICTVNSDTLEVTDSTALYGYSEELYVSENTIYATCFYTERQDTETNNTWNQVSMTRITGIRYGAIGLEVLGSIAVKGAIKDQYSLDEYEGVLRVVTSTTTITFVETYHGDTVSTSMDGRKRNVDLYCIDLRTWQIAASVVAFAPDGEDAQSVRFDGNYAYVCTAEVITVTDPVYFFDLSDLSNITWKDTGTIDGYSSSLINLGDGYLLGIGFNENRDLKIEVYAETEEGVVSVCSYERIADFSQEYKSYLIDRENDLIGLHILDYENEYAALKKYILLHFDGYELQELAVIKLMDGELRDTRAFIADGWLYIFSSGKAQPFTVTKVFP